MSFEHAFLAGMATLAILQLIALGWMARLSNRMTDFHRRFERLEIHQERSERGFREELTVNRREIGGSLRQNREELNGAIDRLSRTLFEQTEQARRSWEEKLSALQLANDAHGERLRQLVDEKLNAAQQDARLGRAEQAESLKHFGELLTNQLHHLAQRHGDGMETLRQSVETRLAAIQSDNQQKLEQMRLTVDEKLHNTLEQRLGESFKLVSERLEQVHKGLGEMQTLASGVGDLKKVLTNVKVRGTWGEVQLDQLLEQILSPDQYAKNVVTRPKASERVEFAIKLPGRDGNGSVVWLPIDAKFPLEDYQKLIDAQEAGDMVALDEAGRALETRIRSEAKVIRDKYLEPPHTTDFGLLFLPIEGLYAEVIRRPGLFDYLQREYRVTVTGPTTLTAILNSLQMGFRTLAIEKRSSEVWQVLGAVKSEFGKFGEILAKTKKKLDEASKTIGQAEVRTRAIDRKLKQVESLPPEQAATFWEEVPEAEPLPAPDLES